MFFAIRWEAAVSSGTSWPTAGLTCSVGPKTEREAMAVPLLSTGTATDEAPSKDSPCD